MADGNQIDAVDIGLHRRLTKIESLGLRQGRDDAERAAFVKVLGRVYGNIVKVADVLGVGARRYTISCIGSA